MDPLKYVPEEELENLSATDEWEYAEHEMEYAKEVEEERKRLQC